MRFSIYFIIQIFESYLQKHRSILRPMPHAPAPAGATLSQHDLRQIVADMVD